MTEKEYKEPSIHWENEQPEEGETYIEQNLLPRPQSIISVVYYILYLYLYISRYIHNTYLPRCHLRPELSMSLNAEPRPTGASDKVNSLGWSWTQWQSDSWPSQMYSEGFLSSSVAFICFYAISRGLFDLDLVQTWSCNRARSCKSCPHLLRKCCVPKLLDARLPHLMTDRQLVLAWLRYDRKDLGLCLGS